MSHQFSMLTYRHPYGQIPFVLGTPGVDYAGDHSESSYISMRSNYELALYFIAYFHDFSVLDGTEVQILQNPSTQSIWVHSTVMEIFVGSHVEFAWNEGEVLVRFRRSLRFKPEVLDNVIDLWRMTRV